MIRSYEDLDAIRRALRNECDLMAEDLLAGIQKDLIPPERASVTLEMAPALAEQVRTFGHGKS